MNDFTLNPEQQKAVQSQDRRCLIIAGAGTGKTRVITERINWLIRSGQAKPEEILALTFTEKAANEMQERVEAGLAQNYLTLSISTFHSFGQRLLEQYGLHLGLPVGFRVLTETDSWLLVKQNLERFSLDHFRPLGNPTKYIHEMIRLFSKCKDELISSADYLQLAETSHLDKDQAEDYLPDQLIELAKAFSVYNQLLLENQALDFGDLISYTHQLLDQCPTIRQRLTSQYRYILVDEFQDVNYAQYELVKKMIGPDSFLMAVGDDDQSIYAFRGASVGNILRFKKDFPEANEIVLKTNYRSAQPILDLAYQTIVHNNPDRLESKLQIDKKLVNPSAASAQIHYYHLAKATEEGLALSKIIQEQKEINPELKWRDFAVLTRNNSQGELILSYLTDAGIPAEFLAASGLWREPLALDLTNYLRAIDSYHESTAIYRLLCLPFWNISSLDISHLLHWSKRRSLSLYESLNDGAPGLSDSARKVLPKIVSLINTGAQMARRQKPRMVLLAFLQASGYLQYLRQQAESSSLGKRELQILRQYLERAREFETTAIDPSVKNFLNYLTEMAAAGDEGTLEPMSSTTDLVNIMTVHTAKGLEFRQVLLPQMIEGRFPTRRRGELLSLPEELIREEPPTGDFHLQEERRLFYVAVTRARESLFFTSAIDYGGKMKHRPSRFLTEAGLIAENLELPAEAQLDFLTGNRIVAQAEEASKNNRLQYSFSRLSTYTRCPYQYKLKYEIGLPVSGQAAFSFGQSIHTTLQRFYALLKAKSMAIQGSLFVPTTTEVVLPALEDLLRIYEQSFVSDWYQNQKQKDAYFQKGKEILRAFYQQNKEQLQAPLALEAAFGLNINGHLIKGRIDRLDRLPDGSLEIIDYKTGKGKEKVEGEDKDQLLLYQLAASSLPEYNNLGRVSRLTYYYLEANNQVSFLGTEKEIEKLKDKIDQTITQIEKQDFRPSSNEQICQYCDFKDICQYRRL